jgi:hypothetical protein
VTDNKEAVSFRWTQKRMALSDLRGGAKFQLRAKPLNTRIVNEYARRMAQGEEFSPIDVARVGRSYIIVDGFHRHAAAFKAGRAVIMVRIATMAEDEAERYAFRANTTHGEKLSPKDKRHRFDEYVRLGLHLRSDGSVQSPYQMEEGLGGVPSYRTIYRYLAENGIEPGVAEDDGLGKQPWSREDAETPLPYGGGERLRQVELLADVKSRIQEIETLTNEIGHTGELRALHHALLKLASLVRRQLEVREASESRAGQAPDLNI